MMWLMHNLQPSARTIAYFRSDNKRSLKQTFNDPGTDNQVAYNIQTTVDSKHNLVIDVKAVNNNDKKMACEMGRRAQAITGRKDFDHLMDKGYHDGETIFLCYNLKRVIKILGFKEFMKRLLAASLFLLKNDVKRLNKSLFIFQN